MRRSTEPGHRRRLLRLGAVGVGAGALGTGALGLGALPSPALALSFTLTRRKGGGVAIEGGFSDTALDRGHRLRGAGTGAGLVPLEDPANYGHVSYLIVGAGIAGLAAARALKARGIDDYRIVELDDVIGGNSRAARVGGLPCPAGAHYLPIPGEEATEVRDLLTELGVRDAAGRYDERMRVHSPQERLFIHGVWQDGLVPQVAQPAAASDARRRFAEHVNTWRARRAFAIPTARAQAHPDLAALKAQTFRAWLDAEGIRDEGLRWFLNYCCRDDYGAGIERVSAWAGLHYFASRHGFAAGDDEGDAGSDEQGTLTWPEGNGWLAARMAEPHRARISTGVMVRRVARVTQGDRRSLRVDAIRFEPGTGRERPVSYHADHVIWTAPAFVAARVLDETDSIFAPIRAAAARMRYAPWVVANLLFDDERVGDWPDLRNQPPAWDNVLYGSQGLGYVDARHQRLDRKGGARLWTWYCSLGDDPQGRALVFSTPWRDWVDLIVKDLAPAHPELLTQLRRVDVHRWGHAMVVPEPELMVSDALRALREPCGNFRMAGSELAGYSVFEEGVYRGGLAGGLS